MGRVKLVIFDIDGTLYRCDEYERLLHSKIVDLIADMLNCSRSEASVKLRELRKEVTSISWSVIKLGISLKDFYDRLSGMVDPSAYLSDAADVRSILVRLKEIGVKVAAHTNAGKSLAMKVLSALKIDPSVFDVVVTSDDALPKPSADGYIKILKEASVEPQDALYVGDRYDIDIKTAHELGMKTILVGKRIETEGVDFFVDNILKVERIVLELRKGSP